MLQKLKYQRFTILWSAFILVMCNISLGKVGESHLFFAGFDKLVHCGFFFLFVVLAANGVISRYKRISTAAIFLLGFLGVLFGALIEVLQLYVFTWRDGNWPDLFADAVGVGMATFSILVLNSAFKYAKA
ncbi:VanZ family protein [Mucilaginibacter agri]|uniref:VanZ family protein n=1 Tax=Mucilaginibacter agri TaxID=2695265 RepID=A0A965ZFK2_9SPHI|nr:VanZ family protein [Mucilaginibacter agri]NCD69192.1 VanZ family protein [Mucilaginibacter agri]